MEINYDNYEDFDEQDMREENEKQIKEIRALLVNELNEIELDDNEDEISNNDSSNNFQTDDKINRTLSEDDSRYEIESPQNCSNDKENQFLPSLNLMNGFPSNWTMTSIPQFYNPITIDNKSNFQCKYPQTNNNNINCVNGLNDSSINWEISLHGEMGVPFSGTCNPPYSEKVTCYGSMKTESQRFLLPEKPPVQPTRVSTRDVAIECIPATQRELDNLELLYSARGKRIEQLQQELDGEREKRVKETRILSHKILLLEGEQKNESNLLRRANEELEEQRQILTDNQDIISMQNNKIEKLECHIDKLKEEIDSCNIVIEGLNEQLADLTSNTVLSRNNQKQAELLDCINRQFDTDSYRLRTEIQRMSERMDEKMKEISKLETLMDEQLENHRNQKSEWKMEVDRLVEELENERLCRKEMENSISQEKIDQLTKQIGDLNLGKSLMEDMNDYLKEQVLQLSHQLEIYEQSLNLLDKNNTINCSSFQDECGEKEENKPSYRGSCPLLTASDSSFDTDQSKVPNCDEISNLRKQLFTVTKRSEYLTNRLFDVRKMSLESKGNAKKLQKTIDDQKETIRTLQAKCLDIEGRLKSLQAGEETCMEKQLKISVESLEILKENLELQCKSLQNQLKQANDSMKDVDNNYKFLENQFEDYKKLAEEDKISCIEKVKNVCNIHYDKLRQQLEQSWLSEKELLLEKEKCHRDEILQDLSDAVKEVDRVKTLYIELSQQKSNEEIVANNWHDWLNKKLDEQKRSLNQQFKNDQESLLEEMELKHRQEMEKMLSEIPENVCREDKNEGTQCLSSEFCAQTDLETLEKFVQVNEISEELKQIDELKISKRRLEDLLNCCEEDCKKLKKENEILSAEKIAIEKENRLLSSTIDQSKTFQQSSFDKFPDHISNLPNIIRSTTPELVLTTKRHQETHYSEQINNQSSKSNIQHQFKLLKSDLITQLSKISLSFQSSDQNSSVNHSRQTLSSCTNSPSELAMENIKEQMYNFVLEGQARAASTLQQELERSQIFVTKSLLCKMRQLIPITLSVDGQLMEIAPKKIKFLVDKLVLMLDHLEESETNTNHCHSGLNVIGNISNATSPFSLTSTPKNRRSVPKMRSDAPFHVFNGAFSNCNSSWSSAGRENIPDQVPSRNANEVQDECQKLKDEIAQLSDALNQSSSFTCSPLSDPDTRLPCPNSDFRP